MREALIRVDATGNIVNLKFDPVGEPQLNEVSADHATACILHGGLLDE
jgi:hypothetical protein